MVKATILINDMNEEDMVALLSVIKQYNLHPELYDDLHNTLVSYHKYDLAVIVARHIDYNFKNPYEVEEELKEILKENNIIIN